MSQEEIDKEEELYREALRATCSLCILEGRCVCGELDKDATGGNWFFDDMKEDEEDLKMNGECDGGHCDDGNGYCMFCEKRL